MSAHTHQTTKEDLSKSSSGDQTKKGTKTSHELQLEFTTKIEQARASNGEIEAIETPREMIELMFGKDFKEKSFSYKGIQVFEEGFFNKEMDKREQSIMDKLFAKG